VKRWKRAVAAALLVFGVVSLAAAGCSKAPQVSRDLTVRLPEFGTGYDPAQLGIIMDFPIANNIFNALLKFKPGTTELEPDLAVAMPEVSADHLTYTFKLRQGVKWHKGYGELTSEDVKFTFERIKDPATKAKNASQYAVISSIETPDKYTVVFHLSRPDPTFLTKLANLRQGFIVCKAAVQAEGADYNRNPIGTGPFVMDHWTDKTEVVLTANKDYFEGAPWLEKITFLPIADDSVAAMSLQKGETDIDIYISSPDTVAKLKSDPNITVSQLPTPGGDMLAFNTRVKPFNDVRVRQAVAYAINIDEFIDKVLGGLGVRGYGPLGEGMLGFTKDVPQYPYDPAKAKELLAEAGYPNGFSFQITLPGVDAFTIPYTAIQGYLKAVGIDMQLNLVDSGAWVAAMSSGNLAASDLGFGARPDPEILLRQFFHSSAFPPGSNFMYYSGADALIDQGAKEFDQAKRAAIYQQVQQKIMQDLPAIPLWFGVETDAYRKDIQGFQPGIFFDYNFYNVKRVASGG